jgi:hypothetical protein
MKLCKYCKTLFTPRVNNQLTCDSPECQIQKKKDKAVKDNSTYSKKNDGQQRNHHKKVVRYGGYFERGIVRAAEKLLATHTSGKNRAAFRRKELERAENLYDSFDTGERVQYLTRCRFCNKPEVDTKAHLCASEKCIGKHERMMKMVQESGFYG